MRNIFKRKQDKKLHLCIICGRDNRYNYIRHTVEYALPVFDTIHIMDTGSTDRTHELSSISPDINYFGWDRWEYGWGDAYDRVRQDVPKGDWFLYLDSDEMPSKYLLDHISDSVSRIDSEGYGQARIPNVLHMDGIRTGDPADRLPRTPEEFKQKHCWTKSIICKNGPWLQVRNNGMHAGYHNVEQACIFLPLYYCHHKYTSQVHASISICSFLLPESYSIPVDREENRALRRLAERFKISNTNHLVDLLQNNPPKEFIEVIQGWRESDLGTCRHWYDWYKQDFAVGDHALRLCDEECCSYEYSRYSCVELKAGSIPRLMDDWKLKSDNGHYFFRSDKKSQTMECNETAAAIMALVDGERSIADIVYNFSDSFADSLDKIGDDTKSVVRDLSRQGVIAVQTPESAINPAVATEINRAVANELKYWHEQGGWDITNLRNETKRRNLIEVTFNNGQVAINWNGSESGRCKNLQAYFQQIAMDASDMAVTFALNPHDSVHGNSDFPVLGFSRRSRGQETAVLIPDIYFINGYSTLRMRVREAATRIRWQDKIDSAIWRGSPTGRANNAENWQENLRVRLCLYARENPECIDAKLTSFAQSTVEASQLMQHANINGDRVPEHKQMFFKYILNVDGNSSSWGGTFWKLLSNSVMVHILDDRRDSNPQHDTYGLMRYSQWYHHWLEKDKHYLSCKVQDLVSTLQWAKEHQSECETIAKEATVFVNQYLTDETGRAYCAELFRAMTSINSGRV
ncbi:MAG: hypothetical protein DHS20C01_10350 [marine bacterium B5-7]|nr:MAG: hypothetical protein DHS20C01_10350 [marine bacterium B5-7]